MICLNSLWVYFLESMLVFLMVWLVRLRTIETLLWNLWHWDQIDSYLFQKVYKIGPRVPNNRAETWVPPGRYQYNWLQHGIHFLKKCGIVCYIFQCFPEIFYGRITNRFSNGIGIDFNMICIIYLDPRVSVWNSPIWLNVHCAHTGAWFRGLGTLFSYGIC